MRFIDLTLATSGDDVPAVAAEAMVSRSRTSFLAGIEAALEYATPALVVLDNCEHVHWRTVRRNRSDPAGYDGQKDLQPVSSGFLTS